MNRSARKAVNLGVLQRHDPNISDILDSSSHVVVYDFDDGARSWTKMGVEGTMFVFKRKIAPNYGFFVMNRLGIHNLLVDVTDDMAIEPNSDYIIYHDSKATHGIWVYEPTDRQKITAQLLHLCELAKETSTSLPAEASPAAAAAATSPGPSVESLSAPSQPAVDPLTRMLNDAMSRVRVSETSGEPVAPQSNQEASMNDASRTPQSRNAMVSQPHRASPTPASPTQLSVSQNNSSGNGIPSFLDAILSRDQEIAPGAFATSSPALRNRSSVEHGSTYSATTNVPQKENIAPSSMDSGRPHGTPLSAELLPASVLPSGLYPSISSRSGNTSSSMETSQSSQHPSSSAGPTGANMNRSSAALPHGSPQQGFAFAYSPGMVPSPLMLSGMIGGPMMHPPPPPQPSVNGGPRPMPPPPPLLPFHHPMGLPQPLPPMGNNFPADAMHAAMGAVGFMGSQNRGFVQNRDEVMPKSKFVEQFMALLQDDPEFMDVLYSNYTAVIARRG